MSAKSMYIHDTGGVDGLRRRNLVTSQVHEIRYLSGPEAGGKYGIRYGSGAIDVRMK